MTRMLAAAVTAALVPTTLATLPAAASAQGDAQYVGDPISYVRQGTPRTQLRVTFRLNVPLGDNAQLAVQTSGGTELGTATAAAFGTGDRPCYRATVALSQPASQGGVLVIVVTTPDGEVLRNVEAISTYTVRQERRVGPRLGCA